MSGNVLEIFNCATALKCTAGVCAHVSKFALISATEYIYFIALGMKICGQYIFSLKGKGTYTPRWTREILLFFE